jgi:hypothetical protein
LRSNCSTESGSPIQRRACHRTGRRSRWRPSVRSVGGDLDLDEHLRVDEAALDHRCRRAAVGERFAEQWPAGLEVVAVGEDVADADDVGERAAGLGERRRCSLGTARPGRRRRRRASVSCSRARSCPRRGPVAVDDRARVSDLVRRRRCCRRRWPGARGRHGYASAGNTPSPGRSGRAISRGVVCSVAIVRQGAASAALRLLRWSKVSLLPASCQRRARRFFLLPRLGRGS